MTKIDIKVGPGPKILPKGRRPGQSMSSVIEAARKMAKGTWFIVPGTPALSLKQLYSKRRYIELKVQKAGLDEHTVSIVDASDGGGIMVRRQAEFMEDAPRTTPARPRAMKI